MHLRSYCACDNVINYPSATLADSSCERTCDGDSSDSRKCGSVSGYRISIYQTTASKNILYSKETETQCFFGDFFDSLILFTLQDYAFLDIW